MDVHYCHGMIVVRRILMGILFCTNWVKCVYGRRIIRQIVIVILNRNRFDI